MKRFLLLLLFFATKILIAQESTLPIAEVYIIDSYVTFEKPYKYILTFFTDDSLKTEIKINNQHSFIISDSLGTDHKAEIEIDALVFDSVSVPFRIFLTDASGNLFRSQDFDFELPTDADFSKAKDPGWFQMCLGGIVFLFPSPGYVDIDGNGYFTLSKEIPIMTIYSGGRNYPSGYIGLEYAYIFNSPKKNFLRLGYKQMFEIKPLEYISPGISGFTDFLGFNGISPEISLGLFKTGQIFTVYLRYRYNFQPSNGNPDFHEVSIGLFSHFFSFNF